MTTAGEVLAEASYTQLVSNGAGGFLALTTDCFDDQGDGLYLIDTAGTVSATGVQTLGTLNWFSNGLMPLISAENNLYGYVMPRGSGPSARSFPTQGRSSKGGRWRRVTTAMASSTGRAIGVLTPKYPDLTFEEEGMALAVETDGSATAFDPRDEYAAVPHRRRAGHLLRGL